jgi:hypothetical protein
VGDDVAWVHPLVEQVHRLALAGALDAADQHEHGELLLAQDPILGGEQRLPQLRLFFLPGGFVDLVGDGGGVEHVTKASSPNRQDMLDLKA